uniref:Adenosine kinase n=1 Tax=Glossina morsitans morsitans TaxID=37546 RepID=A0A1B0FP83_GLOMM
MQVSVIRKTLLFRKNKMNYLQQIYARIFGDGSGSRDYSIAKHDYSCTPAKIITFGNVLLDHTAHLKNQEILKRHKLSLNARAELDVETLNKVTTEAIGESHEEPHLGGSSLNTSRILKILGTDPMFFGAVGDDKQAHLVQELLHKADLNSCNYRLQTVPDTPTGRCICLVYNTSLALYANIGASAKFSTDFLKKFDREDLSSPFLRGPEKKQIIYIEGFFVPQREDVATFIVRNYIKGRRYLALNLSANYIVKLNYHHMLYLANHALFIFGNKDEFETFRECWGASNVEELAKGLVQDGATAKVLVITKGSEGVQMITNFVDEQSPPGELTYQTFAATRVENVVDTTGCGDAFVAAFLHYWLDKRSLTECVRFANDIAAKVAGQVGCNLP